MPTLTASASSVSTAVKKVAFSLEYEHDLSSLLLGDTSDIEALHTFARRVSQGTADDLIRGTLSLLMLDWTSRETAFRATYCEVLLDLASAHPTSAPSILQMAIAKLRMPVPPTSDCDGNDEPPACAALWLVVGLLKILPSMSPFLMPVVEAMFPHQSRPTIEYTTYIENLIRLMQTTASWRTPILELLFSRLIQLDASLRPDEHADQNRMAPSPMSEATDSSLDAGAEEDCRESETAFAALADQDLADKLDCMLSSLLGYIKEISANTKELRRLFPQVMRIFERSIFPISRCHHAQVIVFYVASLDASFADSFLGFLMKLLFSQAPSSSIKEVLVASAYVSSYVARARYLQPELVHLTFDLLLHWSEKFPANRARGCEDETRAFHAVIQAIIYIFCFRHAELAAPFGQRLSQLLSKKSAQPHVYCLVAVVEEFTRIVSCYPSILIPDWSQADERRSSDSERSSRESSIELLDSPLASSASTVTEDFSTYFPFDPLDLPKSSTYITSAIFAEWQEE